jgi:hypothetical protein
VPSRIISEALKLGQLFIDHEQGKYEYDTTPFYDDEKKQRDVGYGITMWIPEKEMPLEYTLKHLHNLHV